MEKFLILIFSLHSSNRHFLYSTVKEAKKKSFQDNGFKSSISLRTQQQCQWWRICHSVISEWVAIVFFLCCKKKKTFSSSFRRVALSWDLQLPFDGETFVVFQPLWTIYKSRENTNFLTINRFPCDLNKSRNMFFGMCKRSHRPCVCVCVCVKYISRMHLMTLSDNSLFVLYGFSVSNFIRKVLSSNFDRYIVWFSNRCYG